MQYAVVLMFGLLLFACAPAEPPEVASDDQGRPIARIALVEAHPFDLQNLIKHKGAPSLLRLLRFLDENETSVIDTNYDKTKSLVTVIGGDYPSGGSLVLNFVQVAGERSEYKVTSSFGPTSKEMPSIVINAFRIARSADVDVTGRIDGQVVAFIRFKAIGPPDEPESGWPLLAGDTELNPEQLRAVLVGKTFALENDGTGQFRIDGKYVRARARGVRTGSYEIREDGLTCTNFPNDRERCYKIVRDSRGNLTTINDRARRYRMEPI